MIDSYFICKLCLTQCAASEDLLYLRFRSLFDCHRYSGLLQYIHILLHDLPQFCRLEWDVRQFLSLRFFKTTGPIDAAHRHQLFQFNRQLPLRLLMLLYLAWLEGWACIHVIRRLALVSCHGYLPLFVSLWWVRVFEARQGRHLLRKALLLASHLQCSCCISLAEKSARAASFSCFIGVTDDLLYHFKLVKN